MFKLNIVDDSKPAYTWNNPSHLIEDYLTQYGNGDIFVETGTYKGETVKLALNFGYNKVYSCELNEGLYQDCVKMFKDNPNVNILLGDSIDCLKDILSRINGPATFWLDAHASGPLVGGRSGGSPVVDELRLIAEHECKEHTIFIDDRRLFGSAEWSYVTEQQALDVLKQINPNYNIHFLDGHAPQDVVCASVK